MNLPSNRYFELVITEEDYRKFIGSGMAYEWEINCPSSWKEHCGMVDFRKKYDYYESVKGSNYKASLKLEGFEIEEEGFERSSN